MFKWNLVELFSGIGSQARAFENVGMKPNVLATCEWDCHAFIAYDAIHNGNSVLPEVDKMTHEELIGEISRFNISITGKKAASRNGIVSLNDGVLKRMLTAIRRCNNLIDVSRVKGDEMPDDIDIMTYSFPCQDLSNVGAFHGYRKGIDMGSGSRSSLLWEVGRILSEMQNHGKKLPRFLVMENVPTLLSKRHKPNFDKWIKMLEDFGYVNKYIPVNAKNYGIPQNRPRLLMMSVYVGNNSDLKENVLNYFDKLGNDETKIIKEYKESKYYHLSSIGDLLRSSSDHNSKLWEETLACVPNDTPSRRRIWNENPKIIDENGIYQKDEYIRTITTKQDRNPNSGNIYVDTDIEGRSKFRYLTPRECMLFMGFKDEDYESIILNNELKTHGDTVLFPRDTIIHLAGNSIPVNMLEGFFYQIKKIDRYMKKLQK